VLETLGNFGKVLKNMATHPFRTNIHQHVTIMFFTTSQLDKTSSEESKGIDQTPENICRRTRSRCNLLLSSLCA